MLPRLCGCARKVDGLPCERPNNSTAPGCYLHEDDCRTPGEPWEPEKPFFPTPGVWDTGSVVTPSTAKGACGCATLSKGEPCKRTGGLDASGHCYLHTENCYAPGGCRCATQRGPKCKNKGGKGRKCSVHGKPGKCTVWKA
jgi:hypothetical protein